MAYLRAKEGLQVYAHKTLLQDLRLGINFVVGQIRGYRSDGGAKTSPDMVELLQLTPVFLQERPLSPRN